jgi:hypothetical protein
MGNGRYLKAFQDGRQDALREVARHSIDGRAFLIEICPRVAGELILAAKDVVRVVEEDFVFRLVPDGQP